MLQRRISPRRAAAEMGELGLNFVGTPLVGKDREERDGFVTGVYAGTGFMLIKRARLERMITAYPETQIRLAHVYPRAEKQSPNQYALFDCMIEPGSNIYLSEDFAFCRRWRQIGGKIWLDTESRLGPYRRFINTKERRILAYATSPVNK